MNIFPKISTDKKLVHFKRLILSFSLVVFSSSSFAQSPTQVPQEFTFHTDWIVGIHGKIRAQVGSTGIRVSTSDLQLLIPDNFDRKIAYITVDLVTRRTSDPFTRKQEGGWITKAKTEPIIISNPQNNSGSFTSVKVNQDAFIDIELSDDFDFDRHWLVVSVALFTNNRSGYVYAHAEEWLSRPSNFDYRASDENLSTSPQPTNLFPNETNHGQLTSVADSPAPQGKRVALLVGNSNYTHATSLRNPQRDVRLIETALRQVGFTSVVVESDLTLNSFLSALRRFAKASEGAEWSVIYYAGHGIELGGVNYLVPTDAMLQSDRDVEIEAVGLNQVLRAAEGATALRLVILDACRDNPFESRMRRSITTRSMARGLARVEPNPGTLVSYAAKHGEIAFDGNKENSPFAKALATRILQTPRLEVRRLFDFVRDDVLIESQNKQQPFTYGSLSAKDDFYF